MAQTAGSLLLMALVACSSPATRPYDDWLQDGKARAERGEISWSEYYVECFARLAEGGKGIKGNSADLEYYNAMIAVAAEYESGKITKQDFEEKRRIALIARAKDREQMERSDRVGGSVHLQTTY